MAVSPNGKNVYVAGASGIAVLDRNLTTGGLTQQTAGTAGCVSGSGTGGTCGTAAALGSFSDAVVVSPQGENVYVAGNDGVVMLNRNTTTGALTEPVPVNCISELGGGGCDNGRALFDVRSIAVSPDGKSVYTTAIGAGDAARGVAIFDRVLGTGLLSQPAGTAGCISAGGFDGCTVGRLVESSFSIVVSPDDDNVYLAGRQSGSVSIFDRNTSTLALTQKAGTDGCITWNPGTATSETCALGNKLPAPTAVVVSPDGENVYMTSQDTDGLALFDRNTATGTLVQRAGAAGCIAGPGAYASGCQAGKAMNEAWGIAVSPNDKGAYVVGKLNDSVAVFARGALVPPGPGPGPGGGGAGGGGAAPAPIRLPKTRPPSRFRTVTGSLKRGTLTVSVDAPGAGTVTVQATGTVTVTLSGAGTAKRVKLTIAKASKRVTKAGTVKLVLKPKGRAKKVLRKKGKLKAKLRLTFKAPGEKATTKTRKATFKFKRPKRR